MTITVSAFQRSAFQRNGFQIADIGPLGSGDWLTWIRLREAELRARKPVPESEPAIVELEQETARDYPIVTEVSAEMIAAAAPTTPLALLTRRPPDQGVEAFHAFILEMIEAEGNA